MFQQYESGEITQADYDEFMYEWHEKTNRFIEACALPGIIERYQELERLAQAWGLSVRVGDYENVMTTCARHLNGEI
jgi:hypothetical protein